MASSLYHAEDPVAWHEACRAYPAALAGVVAASAKKSELPALDRWLLCDLPQSLRRHSVPSLTCEELSAVVRWKLMKGKFRPNLQKYADEADPDAVRSASLKAFACADAGKVRLAAEALTALKGVGPATASAILSAFDPSIPFMSDEALEAVLGTRNYTLEELLALTDALRNKAEALNKAEAERVARRAPHKEQDLGRTIDTGVRSPLAAAAAVR